MLLTILLIYRTLFFFFFFSGKYIIYRLRATKDHGYVGVAPAKIIQLGLPGNSLINNYHKDTKAFDDVTI